MLAQTSPTAPDDITHVIQIALAPAFLLTALATLLNVFSTRLGRVADKVDAASSHLRGPAQTKQGGSRGNCPTCADARSCSMSRWCSPRSAAS